MKLRENLVRSRSVVFDASMIGVKQALEKMWADYVIDPKLNVAFTSSNQVRKHIQAIVNRDGKSDAFPLPYLAVIPVTDARPTEGYNAFALSRIGVRVGLINNGDTEVRERLVPIDVGLGVRFVTNNAQQAEVFRQIWQRQQLSTRFDLQHPNGNFSIAIKMLFDPNVSIPEQDFGGEPGDLIILDTSLIVKTYTGDSEMNTTIQHIDFSLYEPNPGGLAIVLKTERLELTEEENG